jgi:uncharacterized protein YdhG (YjbR/CyaY superfamily)
MKKGSRAVDAYIAAAPKEARKKLETVRSTIRDVAPEARESISYRIPYYSHKGRLAWFGLQKKHIGLYLRPPVIEEHKEDLVGYVTTKSSVHLPIDRQIPVLLVRKLVRARMKINEEEESKSSRRAQVSRRGSGLRRPTGRQVISGRRRD